MYSGMKEMAENISGFLTGLKIEKVSGFAIALPESDMGASKIPKGRAFFAWQIRFFSRCGRLSGCPVRPAGRIRKANSRLIEPGICLFAGWGQRLSPSRT